MPRCQSADVRTLTLQVSDSGLKRVYRAKAISHLGINGEPQCRALLATLADRIGHVMPTFRDLGHFDAQA
jgi:hypothetical protein